MPKKAALALEEHPLPTDKRGKLCACGGNFTTTEGIHKLNVWVSVKLEDTFFVSASRKFNNTEISTALWISSSFFGPVHRHATPL